jgi:hypothetical protein
MQFVRWRVRNKWPDFFRSFVLLSRLLSHFPPSPYPPPSSSSRAHPSHPPRQRQVLAPPPCRPSSGPVRNAKLRGNEKEKKALSAGTVRNQVAGGIGDGLSLGE